jgi:hypothetical protein
MPSIHQIEATPDTDYTDYYENVEAEYEKFLKTEMSYTDTMKFIAGIDSLKTIDLTRQEKCEIRLNIFAKYPQTHSKIAEYFMGEGF